jgi:hypothetical protein
MIEEARAKLLQLEIFLNYGLVLEAEHLEKVTLF